MLIFLPFSVFRRKGISNGIQTERNLCEDLSWNKRNPRDLEWKSRSPRGGHEARGRAPHHHGGEVQFQSPEWFQGIRIYIGERSRSVELRGAHKGGGAPSCLVAASLHLLIHLQVFWFAFSPRKIIVKVSFRLDSVWYSFSAKL